MSPALACGFFTTEPPGEPRTCARDLEITTISKYIHVLRIEAEDITYEFGEEWGAPFKPLQHLSLSQGMNTQHVQRALVFQEGLLTASVSHLQLEAYILVSVLPLCSSGLGTACSLQDLVCLCALLPLWVDPCLPKCPTG